MTVLVTGAAGFIGSHVCDALLGTDERVVGFDSFDDFYDRRVKERNLVSALDSDSFSLVRGDIRDDEALDRLPHDIHAVVHLAARAGVRPSIEQPELYADVNVMGTSRLLHWMRRRSVRRLVFASSSSVYGNNEKVPFCESDSVDKPISPYAATKRAGELICHVASHLDGASVACLRFFTVYGPRQRPDLAIHKFARLILQGRSIPVYGDGTSSRDYTYIDDTVAGVLGALKWVDENPGGFDIFNLGNHRTVSLTEMIQVVQDELGVGASIEHLPSQQGDVERTFADIRHAQHALGYEPRTEFRSGVRRFVSWLRGEVAFPPRSA